MKLPHKISLLLEDALIKNAYYLVSDGVFNVILGFLFWALATRLYDSTEVGLGSVGISAISLIVAISAQGFGAGLIRFLPQYPDRTNKLINLCLTLSGALLVLFLSIFYMVLPFWSESLRAFLNGKFILFSIIAFAYLFTIVLDSAFIAHRKPQYLVTKNLQLNVIKIFLLILFLQTFNGIYLAWGFSILIICIMQSTILMRKVNDKFYPKPTFDMLLGKVVFAYSMKTHVADLLAGLPSMIAPILIIEILDAKMAAYFAIVWMLMNSLIIISKSATISLFVEASNNIAELNKMVRKTIKFVFIQMLPVIFIMALFGKYVLLIFGNEYSTNGYSLLLILMASLLPYSLNTTYFTILRIEKRLSALILLSFVMSISIVGLSYIMILKYGLIGMGFGWFIPHILCSLYSIWKLKHYISMDEKYGIAHE